MTATAGESAPAGQRTGLFIELRGGLLWALALDVTGTTMCMFAAAGAATWGDPEGPYYTRLASIAFAGVILALVSVGMAVFTLGSGHPSSGILRASIALVLVGLALNTGGTIWALNDSPVGPPALAVLVLMFGDAFSLIYVTLQMMGLRRSRR